MIPNHSRLPFQNFAWVILQQCSPALSTTINGGSQSPANLCCRRLAMIVFCSCVCVYYCRAYYKAVRGGGEEESGGHVL